MLLLGGAGFVGSNLARRLLELGARVSILDAFIPGLGGNSYNLAGLEDQLQVVKADVRDPSALAAAVEGKEIIFNLIGQTSHLDSMEDPFTDLELNSRSQLLILEALRKHNPQARVIFSSTRQIYGRPEYLPVDENHRLKPIDVNGIHKIAAEEYHLLYHKIYGIPVCVLRLTNTYGPRMRIRDARQTFLGEWIRLILTEKPMKVFGSGKQLRDFNYVEDAVEAFLLTAREDEAIGKVYNLGGRLVSLKALAEELIAVHGSGSYECVPFPAELASIDIGDYYADSSKIRADLGWEEKVPLREGLRRTLDYYRQCLEHYCEIWKPVPIK